MTKNQKCTFCSNWKISGERHLLFQILCMPNYLLQYNFTCVIRKFLSGSFSPFGHLPGDRAFCVSPDKMAITFCILGLIFLFAVIVATLALLRARRSGENLLMPYYTRSLFSSYSSDSSSGSTGGSKLLLHETQPPYLGHQSTSRGLHYGRIL